MDDVKEKQGLYAIFGVNAIASNFRQQPKYEKSQYEEFLDPMP